MALSVKMFCEGFYKKRKITKPYLLCKEKLLIKTQRVYIRVISKLLFFKKFCEVCAQGHNNTDPWVDFK